MTHPNRVLVAGDWHGNGPWARWVIRQAMLLLSREELKLILHAGDFGFWPGEGGEIYLAEVCEELRKADMELLFVDGNYEWHPELDALREEDARRWPGSDLVAIPIGRDSTGEVRVSWLPRGHRWSWHGKTWMGLGGAVSVDRDVRIKRRLGWWPGETLTGEQIKHAIRPGKVDVMLTHDAPSAVPMIFGRPPSFWLPEDLARSDAHRDQLQDVVDKLQPQLLIHGHYHQLVRASIPPYDTEVIGLDMDGTENNFTVINTRTLKEELPWTP